MVSNYLRRFLELASRNRIFRRKLPGEFGSAVVYVSPDSALQFLKPSLASQSMSTPLLALTRSLVKKGDHIWDIGANVGVLTFAAAHKVGDEGSVLGVEADYFLGWLLQRSVNANVQRLPNVRILCAAVSDKIGFSCLQIAERGRASNGIKIATQRSQSGGVRYNQDVVTITLDSLLEEYHEPSLVKIDVEGAETYALRGAFKLLSQVRPKVYIEVGEYQAAEVTTILRDHRYELFDGESETLAPIESCVFNTLAVPLEKMSDFKRSHC